MTRHIFREYDIRGVVDTDLSADVVTRLGKALGTYFIGRDVEKISLGRDGRISSDDIRDELEAGLLSTGIDVVDLGVITTPLSYYSTHRLAVDGAIMITGSHNPPDYNGFKISCGTETIYGRDIQDVADIFEKGGFTVGSGSSSTYDLIPEYLTDLEDRLQLARPVKLAIDCGNGVGGVTAKELFNRLGCDPVMLFDEVDGNFPNHHPDPTIESNLTELKRTVIGKNLDIGIAYDGDADRIGVVDETGKVLWGDQILAVLARDVLKQEPGAVIIGEVKCSQLLFDDIEKHGGKPLMWKVGHSLIKSKMIDMGALLAGEMSGHIFFKHRYYGFDDAVYVTGRLLEIIARSDKPVSRLLEDWPKLYNTPEIRVDCPEEIKFDVVNKVRDLFRTRYEVVDVDGMRVIMNDGWGLLRASNTQPVVVLRFEAVSMERLDAIRGEVTGVLEKMLKGYA